MSQEDARRHPLRDGLFLGGLQELARVAVRAALRGRDGLLRGAQVRRVRLLRVGRGRPLLGPGARRGDARAVLRVRVRHPLPVPPAHGRGPAAAADDGALRPLLRALRVGHVLRQRAGGAARHSGRAGRHRGGGRVHRDGVHGRRGRRLPRECGADREVLEEAAEGAATRQ